jgi:hypothetical protein
VDMTVRLSRSAFEHAKQLIRDGHMLEAFAP